MVNGLNNGLVQKASLQFAKRTLVGKNVLFGLLLATVSQCAYTTELVGRVVDTMGEKVFESASVQIHQRRDLALTALTDQGGFFRIDGLSSGSYSVNITLSDGRSFTGRALVNGARRTQFVEFDYSRLVPPSDEDDY